MIISFKEQYNNSQELDLIIKKIRDLGGIVFATNKVHSIKIQCEYSKKKQIKEAIKEIKKQFETY